MFNKPCSQLDSPWNELTQNDSYLQTNSGLENSYHLKLLFLLIGLSIVNQQRIESIWLIQLYLMICSNKIQ